MTDEVAPRAVPISRSARRRVVSYVIALGFLQTLSTFTIDIYLPAFPQIASGFGVSASSIQFTFTGAMIGMVAGQIIAGPISDGIGRKLPMLIATCIHVAASLLCAMAPSVPALIAGRMLQGAASAATGALALAMVRDLYRGLAMMRMLASMALISGLAIVIGPLLGSTLLSITDWRGVFGGLAGYGLVLGLGVLLVVGETLPRHRRQTGGLRIRARAFRTMIIDRQYLGYVLVSAFAWMGMYSYLAASSFLFQRVYRLTEMQYGLAFGSHALAMFAGTQSAARLAHRIAPRRLIMMSTTGLALAATALLVVGISGSRSLLVILVPLWAFTFFIGINTPCAQTLALSRQGHAAGSAASFLNASRQALGALATPITGLIGVTSAIPVAAVMMVGQLLAVLVLWLVARPQRDVSIEPA